jgi:ADP-heptose:LPS heptosyltransferase
MNKSEKILLINFGGIGDEILFLPTIRSIKERYPNSEITLCLEPRSKGIIDLCPDINKLILADIKSKHKYIELLKFYFKALFGRYDIVVSSGANKMIPILLFFMGIKTRIGYDCGGITKRLLTKAVKLSNKQFAGRMYHNLVDELTGIDYKNPQVEIEYSKECEGMILIHPGVSKMSIKKNIIKSYGNEKWGELVELLLQRGEKVALCGGPDDEECIKDILQRVEGKDNFYNFYGKTRNLRELGKLMTGAKKVICCDSAPMHLAIALNVPIIALFGPTDEVKLVPQRDNISVIVAKNCHCRPCLWDKRAESCKEKTCLEISNKQILELI